MTSHKIAKKQKQHPVVLSDAAWLAIEADYRAGVKTLRVIAEEHNITHAAILKRARRDEWDRDLSAKIKLAAQARVTKAAVSKEVTKTRLVTEKATVEANAAIQADIILAHRKDIPHKRDIVNKLFAEVEGITDQPDLMEQLVLALESGDQDKLAEAGRRVASLPARIKGAAELVSAFKSLVELERRVFGISEDSDDRGLSVVINKVDIGCL